MASTKQRLTSKVARVRERRPFVDHVFRMVSHYGEVKGNAQAGAVTFFGFLSFFPILALAFFVIGYVSKVYPDAQDQLAEALEQVLPGVVGEDEGEISLSTFEAYAGTVGIIGLVGLLYSGLGWLSGMRDALGVMFSLTKKERPGFLAGKARDLLTLALLGLILIFSVALSGLVTRSSELILGWLSLDGRLASTLLTVLALALAMAATTLLLVVMFALLAQPHVSRRALFQGAFLGAIGFEALKVLASFLIAQTSGRPAFQAFGVALILLLWINYFSRLVMYGAAWAHTSRADERQGTPKPVDDEPEPRPAPTEPRPVTTGAAGVASDGHRKALALAGGAAGLAIGALALKKLRSGD